MWRRLDRVTRFCIVVMFALWPLGAIVGAHAEWGWGLVLSGAVAAFLWAVLEGLKAVFIYR